MLDTLHNRQQYNTVGENDDDDDDDDGDGDGDDDDDSGAGMTKNNDDKGMYSSKKENPGRHRNEAQFGTT
jgi:hypothetical protein